MVGAALPVAPDRTAFVGIHRPRNNEPFGTADVAQLNVLIPHLTRAIQLTMRLSDAGLDHQVALDGLERTHSATLVVDGNGRILFATRLAEAALREVGGLHAVNGRLFGADRVSSARLAHLIRGAADTAAGAALHTNCGGLAIEREDGRLPLTVLVAPFRPNRPVPGAQIPAALVFIRDPELGTVANEILTDLFGFTRAQAAVAAHMANGESLEQIALALRISLLTARDHLKAIFAKTGTSRQSQLVALLSRTVATLESRAAASE
jgi:DNA-binding CsgD family transcriptional regulator